MIKCEFEKGHKTSLRHITCDAVVCWENNILLVKRVMTSNKEPGKYALPGGFMERDETTGEAALRELKEETGYVGKIQALLWINDNPYRTRAEIDDRQNVSFFYLIEAKEKVSSHDKESDDIEWFDLDHLPPQEQIAFDHYEVIKLYQKWQKKKFKLPIIGGIKNVKKN